MLLSAWWIFHYPSRYARACAPVYLQPYSHGTEECEGFEGLEEEWGVERDLEGGTVVREGGLGKDGGDMARRVARRREERGNYEV